MNTYPRALTIAGSDSGGGAGIQADLKTFSALGCYGLSVVTALTAQNTMAVTGIHPVPPEFIEQQIDAVMSDIGADAIKIGMLHSGEVIHAVAERLIHHRARNIVVDPVMVAKSGDRLLQAEAVEALTSVLLPLATIITPNIPEAEALLGRPISGVAGMHEACAVLAELGPQAVLLKGGHLPGDKSPDLLYVKESGSLSVLEADRIKTNNTHGTGCTLSSAIAAYLARGYSVSDAVAGAKHYITQAIRTGAEYRLGHGHGPVHHYWDQWGADPLDEETRTTKK